MLYAKEKKLLLLPPRVAHIIMGHFKCLSPPPAADTSTGDASHAGLMVGDVSICPVNTKGSVVRTRTDKAVALSMGLPEPNKR